MDIVAGRTCSWDQGKCVVWYMRHQRIYKFVSYLQVKSQFWPLPLGTPWLNGPTLMPQSHLFGSVEDVWTSVSFTDVLVSGSIATYLSHICGVQGCLEGDWKVSGRCVKDPLQIQVSPKVIGTK